LERLKAAEGAPADDKFAEQFQKFITILEAIAADLAVASRERSSAQRMLDQMTAIIRGACPPADPQGSQDGGRCRRIT
jgi:hypothetical protein